MLYALCISFVTFTESWNQNVQNLVFISQVLFKSLLKLLDQDIYYWG